MIDLVWNLWFLGLKSFEVTSELCQPWPSAHALWAHHLNKAFQHAPLWNSRFEAQYMLLINKCSIYAYICKHTYLRDSTGMIGQKYRNNDTHVE